jgi:hypothetical protein
VWTQPEADKIESGAVEGSEGSHDWPRPTTRLDSTTKA